MTQPGPNDALSQNFMMLRLLVASENVNKQTYTQDSCFISIDVDKSFIISILTILDKMPHDSDEGKM